MTRAPTAGRERSTIEPVKAAQAHELVLEQLRRAIRLGRFLPGAKLPPERSLAGQLGVSRTTLRAALGILAREGVLEIRRGVTGGIFVRRDRVGKAPPEITVKAIEDAHTFRLAVERAAVRLAAARRTQNDLNRLTGLLRTMTELTATRARRSDPDNVARFIATDVQFHLAIAAAARHTELEHAIDRALAQRYVAIGAVFAALVDDANVGHAELVSAIADGNATKAERAMIAHLERSFRNVRAATGR